VTVARIKFNAREFFRPRRPSSGSLRSRVEPETNPALEEIWNVIAAIPRGQVSTYGDVARRAGLPGHARQVAYALRNIPEELELPWHRVLGAGGRIVFPKDSKSFREQARRLKADGVPVKMGRVPRAALMNAERY
jgi:methylated-DNA-protein-cysteine methyltransferase-like protein